jgi:hypothetical protein
MTDHLEPAYTGQGTRLEETAPWLTYEKEMQQSLSKELEEEVAEYAKHHYDEAQSSNQTKEELHKQREINQEAVKEYQWATPQEYEDAIQRIGRVMHHAVFINKLRDIGITCWYCQHPHIQKAVLWVQRGRRKPEMACWVQQGFMQELSILRFDDKGVPLDERRRGWRTCLLQLILKGIITEDKAVEVFGHPKTTRAFSRYNSTLFEWRKRKDTNWDDVWA